MNREFIIQLDTPLNEWWLQCSLPRCICSCRLDHAAEYRLSTVEYQPEQRVWLTLRCRRCDVRSVVEVVQDQGLISAHTVGLT